MKRFMLFLILLLAITINVDFGEVHADATSTGMGFDVDSNMYGVARDESSVQSDVYFVKDGDSYKMGWSKYETAVYTDQSDDDWALVIMKTHVDAYDVSGIPYFWFVTKTYKGAVENINLHSHIDNATSYVYYPYLYYSASGFEMTEPEPMYTPVTDVYNIGIEFDGTFKVSATTDVEDNELDISIGHDGSDNVFDVDYEYSCSLFSCEYRRQLNYQRGLFLVDMRDGYHGTTGDFINNSLATFSFKDSNGRFDDVIKTIWSFLKY